MRAVKSVTIDSERRVIITFLDGSIETLYPNLICCDAEALRDIIKELLEEKADAIVQTINNVAIATFDDGADEALIRKLLVSIKPIQEGTGDPSPENVRPITGRTGLSVVRCGKNLWDAEAIVRSSGHPSQCFIEDGYLKYATGKTETNGLVWTGLKIPCPCTLSGTIKNFANANNQIRFTAYFDDGTTQTDIIDTTLSGNESKKISSTIGSAGKVLVDFKNVWTSGNRAGFDLSDTQLEIGSTATDYEPYKGTEVSVNLETEAGTVYYGSLDVVSGKLSVDGVLKTFVGATSEGWVYSSSSNPYFYCQLGNLNVGINYEVICDTFPNGVINAGNNTQGVCVFNSASYNGFLLYLRWDALGITALTDFRNWLSTNNVTICYKLSRPIEIQITPQEITTLLGTNNIWADSGDILELEYVADTKLYIGESQSGTLGSGRQPIINTDLQPVSEKTVEDLTEAVKAETEQKETQEETEYERGE